MNNSNQLKSLAKGPYDPISTEKEILEYWNANNFNKPEYSPEKGLQADLKHDKREPFCIICPPPNANGRPHLGHISGYSYQDLMGRYQRMKGKKVLLLPGKDHAGIQTEAVFERDVLKKKGLTKLDLGRTEFFRQAFNFCRKNAEFARKDEMRVGLSADFERDTFTLDPEIVRLVLDTFIKLYKDKMIYKGTRITNWCPSCQTALADIDCERKERMSELIFIKYPLKDSSEFITIATTRVETMLADTAVAVNPKDKRYKNLIGKKVILPLLGREIPIITDPKVDKEFGTGALKITPAHAPEDYEIMLRWNENNPESKIDYINVIWKDSKLYGPIGRYKGMTIEEAKKAVFADLEKLNLIVKKEEINQNVQICERCKNVIEPIISTQWYVQIEKLRDMAEKAVKDGDVRIHPKFMEKKYFQWMKNMRPWPISRSLWWGYRIPAWYNGKLIEEIDENGKVVEKIINSKTGKILLVPGKHAYANNELFPKIKMDFNNTTVIHVEDPEHPNYKDYEQNLKKHEINGNDTIVAHSIGCQAVIEYILRNKVKIKNFILIAPTNTKYEKFEEFKKAGFWDNMGKYSKIENLIENIHIIYSDNDPLVNQKDCEEFSNLLGNSVKMHLESGKGHFAEVNFTRHSENLNKLLSKINSKNHSDSLHVGFNPPDLGKIFLVPGKHGYANNRLFPSIQNKYLNASRVHVENLDQPSYKDYEIALKKIEITEKDSVVAHSLGCPGIIEFLIQNNKKIDNLICIAPNTPKALKFKLYKEKGFWKNIDNYEKLKNLINKIYIIYSDNDGERTVECYQSFEKLFKRNAEITLEPGKKHFAGHDYTNNSEKVDNILSELNSKTSWVQDDDVLDTWFSSGQWPFVTLQKENLMNTFYPTQVMETMYDILEWWVSRMIMLGIYKTGKKPFSDVYLHGMLLAPDGQKMSKSKGNGVEMSQIVDEYGADTLRLFYYTAGKAGSAYRLDWERMKFNRNFLNKLWNGAKFVLSAIKDYPEIWKEDENKLNFTKEQKKNLMELEKLAENVGSSIEKFKFNLAIEELFESYWHKFCDVCIEESKEKVYSKTDPEIATKWYLWKSLKTYITLLHPFIPFMTEKLWQVIPKSTNESETVMYGRWEK